MTITKTVEIPADRRLTIEVPREIPTGRTNIIIQFPVKEGAPAKRRMTEAEEIESINRNIEYLTNEALDNISYQNMFLDD